MSDEQLRRVDPLVMNLAVARGVPEYGRIDVRKYVSAVDAWAAMIAEANRLAEPHAAGDSAYEHDRRVWLAGGMDTMLAGPRCRVTYTKAKLDPARPGQQFVCGLIDTRQGTCATMPVLYMSIGHRLGWPIRAVVARDHMWARWDDGQAEGKDGARFNLEATATSVDGPESAFYTPPDEAYIKDMRVSRLALGCGSDMTSLTPRQVLGVFLQGRAGYWAAKGSWTKAEHDLLLAVRCFPQNREIRSFLVHAMSRVNERVFTRAEQAGLASRLLGVPTHTMAQGPWGQRHPHWRPGGIEMSGGQVPGNFDVDAINRANRALLDRMAGEATNFIPGQAWAPGGQPGW
jgi:hypothetical protein